MRTEKEMMELILRVAREDERIRIVGMEGSRTNVNVPKDEFQDYDVSYLVTDMASFLQSDDWLDVFGKRIIMQKPEAMHLFPPDLGNWFSYLMIFEDGNRIDLTLIPLNEVDHYINSDTLIKILLDKDGRVKHPPIPTDQPYHVQKPSKEFFIDCCNEFWWVSTYVAKGLCRNEYLYAVDHLNQYVRPMLLKMMSWQVGIETKFSLSVGKSYKYLDQYLPSDIWKRLQSTFRNDTVHHLWESLFRVHELFRQSSQYVAKVLGYPYPDFDDNVTKYIHKLYEKYHRKD